MLTRCLGLSLALLMLLAARALASEPPFTPPSLASGAGAAGTLSAGSSSAEPAPGGVSGRSPRASTAAGAPAIGTSATGTSATGTSATGTSATGTSATGTSASESHAAGAAASGGVDDATPETTATGGTEPANAGASQSAQQPPAQQRQAGAAAAEPWQPKPFQASYRVSFTGVPFSVTGERELARTDSGFWMRQRVSAWLIKLVETSTMGFSAEEGFLARRYHYERSGIGKDEEKTLDFDWNTGVASKGPGDRGRIVLTAGTPVYDPLGYQLALRRDLIRGDAAPGSRYSYQVTDGDAPQRYSFELRGRRKLDLPAGHYETVYLERRYEPDDPRSTRIWLAPALQYRLVKLEHIDDDDRTLTLELAELE